MLSMRIPFVNKPQTLGSMDHSLSGNLPLAAVLHTLSIMETKANAPAFARHEILVNASVEKVWGLLSDIDHWSSWQPDIPRAGLEGPLAPGTTFRWKSGGASVVSVIQEVVALRRLGWTGKAMGARARHLWVLEPRGGSVIVRTEESFEGWIVVLLKGMMQKTLDTSLKAWLRHLKETAERGA